MANIGNARFAGPTNTEPRTGRISDLPPEVARKEGEPRREEPEDDAISQFAKGLRESKLPRAPGGGEYGFSAVLNPFDASPTGPEHFKVSETLGDTILRGFEALRYARDI